MRKFMIMSGVALVSLVLTGCGSGGGILNRARPDEFAVQRAAPLVVPPDFALAPPTPGASRISTNDRMTTPSRVGIAVSRRRTRRRSICLL